MRNDFGHLEIQGAEMRRHASQIPGPQEDWQAETLFVHDSRGVGFLVQPRPARCVLMHQDVLHRVSAPSRLAQRARFSLVWKLAFLPRRTATRGQQQPHAAGETICRAEWGKPLQL